MEREAIEKIKKMMKVSTRLKLDMMQRVLKLNQEVFEEKIFDWASQFDFTIDDDFLVVNKERIDDFIEALDKQFEIWDKKERGRIEKI